MNETTPDIDCCLVTRTFVLGQIHYAKAYTA